MKKTLYVAVLLFALGNSLYAFVGNPWMVDTLSNPAKLFFSGNSVFIGEVNFKDNAGEKDNPNTIMQNPSLNMEVSIVGTIAGLNLGFTSQMVHTNTKGNYMAYMSRHMNIMFAYGYKYFSIGVNLFLSDLRYRTAVFNNSIPILSFFAEGLFKEYVDMPGSVNTNLGLSLMVTDGEYFGFGAYVPEFFLFNSSNSVFDSEKLYKSINFGISFRSPRYDSNDDLIPFLATVNIDTLRILDSNKTVTVGVDLSLILSPDMYISFRNILDFYIFQSETFTFTNDRYFLHTMSVFFDSTRFRGEVGVDLSPSVYRGESKNVPFFFSFRFIL